METDAPVATPNYGYEKRQKELAKKKKKEDKLKAKAERKLSGAAETEPSQGNADTASPPPPEAPQR